MTTRRDLLAGAGAGVAAISTASFFAARRPAEIDGLFIYDSRNGAPQAQTKLAPGAPRLDIRNQDRVFWRDLRNLASITSGVSGLLSWSTWVIVRGLLEERGKRVVEERRIEGGAGQPTLFYWRMR